MFIKLLWRKQRSSGMQVILYDDYAFPTGTVAGQFYQKFPQLMASRLDKVEADRKGKGTLMITFPEGTVLGAVLMNQGDKSLKDVSDQIQGKMLSIPVAKATGNSWDFI